MFVIDKMAPIAFNKRIRMTSQKLYFYRISNKWLRKDTNPFPTEIKPLLSILSKKIRILIVGFEVAA